MRLSATSAAILAAADGGDMLKMFEQDRRNAKPAPKLMPWAGGYVGIWLTSGAATWTLTGCVKTKAALDTAVQQLVSCQAPHGYIGPWPSGFEFKRDAPNAEVPWDVWGHHYIIEGALAWHRASGSRFSLQLATSVADLLVRKFGSNPADLHSLGAQHAAGILLTSLSLLHEFTSEDKYLEGAKTILKFLEMPGTGRFVSNANQKKPFAKGQVHGWEALLTLRGLAAFGRTARGNPEAVECADAALFYWWDVCQSARHPNGGVLIPDHGKAVVSSSDDPRICSTYAWVMLTAELWLFSHNPVLIDEMELVLFNAAARLATSDLPISTSAGDIPVHGKLDRVPTSIENVHLCSVGLLPVSSSHGFAIVDGVVIINLFHAGVYSGVLPSKNSVSIAVDTRYPHDGLVSLQIKPKRRGEQFPVWVRIPTWASATKVLVDMTMAGQPEEHEAPAGQYFKVEKAWCSGDLIKVDLGLSLRFKKVEGFGALYCMYYGPLLLATEGPAASASFALQSVKFMLSRVPSAGGAELGISVVSLRDETVIMELTAYYDVDIEGKELVTRFKIDFGSHSSTSAFSKSNPQSSFTVPDLVLETATDASTAAAAPQYDAVPAYSPRASIDYERSNTTPTSKAGVRRNSVAELLAAHESKSNTLKKDVKKQSKNKKPPAESKKKTAPSAASDPAKVSVPSSSVVTTAPPVPTTNKIDLKKQEDELLEARAVQSKLRELKSDMESKAAQIQPQFGAKSKVQNAPLTTQESKSTDVNVANTKAPKVENACVKCGKAVYFSERLQADGQLFHKACFRCSEPNCNKMLGLGNYAAMEGTLYCKPCFKKMFKLKGNYAEGFGKEQHKKKWLKKTDGDTATPAGSAISPGISSRRQSTRKMLNSALTETAPTASLQVLTNEGAAELGEGYDLASAQEISSEPKEEKFEISPQGLQPKSSWKKSWRQMLKKSNRKVSRTKKGSAFKKPSETIEGDSGVRKTADEVASSSLASRGRSNTSGWQAPVTDTCVKCGKPVYFSEKLQADNQIFHKACFRCTECSKMLGLGNYAAMEGCLYCKPCFKKMFKLKGNYAEGFGKEQHKKKWLNK